MALLHPVVTGRFSPRKCSPLPGKLRDGATCAYTIIVGNILGPEVYLLPDALLTKLECSGSRRTSVLRTHSRETSNVTIDPVGKPSE